MNEIKARHEALKTIETPVLIAWAKRVIGLATRTVADEAARTDAPRDDDRLWLAQNQVDIAAKAFGGITRNRKPTTVRADPDDFGVSSITFSREQSASDMANAAARAIAGIRYRKGLDHYEELTESVKAELYADLFRNIGVEA